MRKKIFYFIFIFLISGVFASPVFASSTDGAIDSAYKYAWGENIGWVNFGASNGNVHITDSALSGSALSENIGWINLDNVSNDGEGNLSGYGWSENAGWIKFNPASGGVIINSSGEFTGSALSETMGWIIFGGDYKVKTDWRPQTIRPACNNSLDDDSDGLVDYPADLGCESLTDTDEINPGVGLPPATTNPPQTPSPTKANPQGGFKILINNGDEYANKKDVELKLFGGNDTKQFAVSQNSDFKNATLQPYQPNSSGFQVLSFTFQDSKLQDTKYKIQDTKYQVFAKFYTQYGQSSEVVSDAIILKEEPTTPPEKTPQKTAEQKTQEFAEQIINITTDAVELTKSNVNSLLATVGAERDLAKEGKDFNDYIKNLIKDTTTPTTQDQQNTLTNFITYGTSATLKLGEGERAGVVSSYKSTFGKLPDTQDEWSDILKIANGRWPSKTNETAEATAAETFKKIYLRDPNRTNPNDDAAVVVMAYGLRPVDRNLDSEKAAIKTFKNIYKYSPTSASDWDAVRAAAYSGARR